MTQPSTPTTIPTRARRASLGLLLAVISLSTVIPALASEVRQPSGTGSLTGAIRVGEEIARRRIDFPLYPDPSRQAPERPRTRLEDEVRNVVIFFETEWEGLEPVSSGPSQVMKQENETFEPHVLPVLVGTSVEFPNADPFFHNVFSLSSTAAFDLGHYPRGQSRSVEFDTPGIVKVFCHLHSDMSAVILVLENPFFTVADDAGRYRIDGIPAGTYEVVAWHERAKRVSRTIVIEPGRATRADFDVPLRNVHPDD